MRMKHKFYPVSLARNAFEIFINAFLLLGVNFRDIYGVMFKMKDMTHPSSLWL